MSVIFQIMNDQDAAGMAARLQANQAMLVAHQERMSASKVRLAASEERIEAGKVRLAISLERIQASEERLRQSEELLRRNTQSWPIGRLIGTSDLPK